MRKTTTLLIVDDDADDQELFVEAAAEIDPKIHCLCAYNGEEALQMLNTTTALPQIIFLDLNMPRMNGRQCLNELHKKNEWVEIPVVIYTTTRRKEDESELKNMGAVCFLTKPNSFDGIRKVISLALKKDWNKIETMSLSRVNSQ